MKKQILMLLGLSLIQHATTRPKNIFAKLFGCCKAQNQSTQPPPPVHSQPAIIASTAPTPNSSSGSHMSGYLRVIVVDHPQGHIAPNPTPESALH